MFRIFLSPKLRSISHNFTYIPGHISALRNTNSTKIFQHSNAQHFFRLLCSALRVKDTIQSYIPAQYTIGLCVAATNICFKRKLCRAEEGVAFHYRGSHMKFCKKKALSTTDSLSIMRAQRCFMYMRMVQVR